MAQNVGIIGSGIVGQTLALGFLGHGYSVMVGSRMPEKLNDWKARAGAGIQTGTYEQAAMFGEIIVLATKGKEAENSLQMAKEANLSSKTIIDVTNPIDDSRPPENGVLHYYTTLEESQMERLQKKFPKANFVKAFNSIGNAYMVNPDFGGIKPSMFICGNSGSAKKEVSEILVKFEPLCILWCIPGFINNKWGNAFKLLKK